MLPRWDEESIDGAFAWDPTLSHLLLNGGHVLIDASAFFNWGRPTYQFVVVADAFKRDQPETVKRILGIMATLDESFKDRTQNGLWTPTEGSLLDAAYSSRSALDSSNMADYEAVNGESLESYLAKNLRATGKG